MNEKREMSMVVRFVCDVPEEMETDYVAGMVQRVLGFIPITPGIDSSERVKFTDIRISQVKAKAVKS